VDRGVEHERDSREVLYRAVVQEECDAPAFVLLGRDQPVEPVVGQSAPVNR
jgi:hypothetical protein